MTCREFTERLAAHLDHTLPRRADLAGRRHLARCRACRDYLSHYCATVNAVRALGEWDDLESDGVLDVSRLLSAAATGPIH